MTTTYTAADVAAMPTPALLALFNEATGKQTKKFASRADAERQAMRVLATAGRIVEAADTPVVVVEAQAEPAVDAAATPVKVTANEGRLLTNIARNLMTGLNGAEPNCAADTACWANQLNDGPFNISERSLPGLMASLVKKGLATTNGEGCELTEAGFAVYKALPPPSAQDEAKAKARPAAPAVAPPATRGGLVASVVGAFRAHFATGAESVNLKELAPKIGVSERTLRQAMDAAKRKGFSFPSLGKCCFGFVDPKPGV